MLYTLKEEQSTYLLKQLFSDIEKVIMIFLTKNFS